MDHDLAAAVAVLVFIGEVEVRVADRALLADQQQVPRRSVGMPGVQQRVLGKRCDAVCPVSRLGEVSDQRGLLSGKGSFGNGGLMGGAGMLGGAGVWPRHRSAVTAGVTVSWASMSRSSGVPFTGTKR